jgi:hypothetical protein
VFYARSLGRLSIGVFVAAFIIFRPFFVDAQISSKTRKQLTPFKKQLDEGLNRLPDRKSRMALLQRRAKEQRFDEAVPEVVRMGRLSAIAHRMFREEGGEDGRRRSSELFEQIVKNSSTLEFKLDALRMLANSHSDPGKSLGRYLEIIRLVRAAWEADGQPARKHRFAMANAHANAFHIAKSMNDRKLAVSLAEAYVSLNLDMGQDRAGKAINENMAKTLERAGKPDLAKRLRSRGGL